MTRKYECIKQFPNTDIKPGDVVKIKKLNDTEYVIDEAIRTDRKIVYEYFKIKKIKGFDFAPYSHSKMESWNHCPKKFQFKYIIKPDIPSVASPILEKGTLFHAVLEFHVIDKLDEFHLDDEFEALKEKDMNEIVSVALDYTKNSEDYKWIKNLPGQKVPEQAMYLGPNLEPVETLEDSLIRGFIDLLIYDEKNNKCYIFDWKTGGKSKEQLKKWPKPNDQLELYAIWANGVFGVDEIETAFVYVEQDHMAKYKFTKKDIPILKKKFKHKVDNIEQDDKYKKNPSILCAWCDFKEECLGISLEREPRSISKDEILEAAKKTRKTKAKKSNSKNEAFMKKILEKNRK